MSAVTFRPHAGTTAHSRQQHGAFTFEFSIAAGACFFIVVSVLSYSLFHYQRLALQHAVATATRQAVTGGVAQNASRLDAIANVFVSRGRDYGLALSSSHLRVCPGSMPQCTTNDPGLSGGFVLLTARYPSLLPILGSVEIEVSMLAKNEPF